MGLDICHVRPAPKSKETIEYFLLDEFQDNLIFLERHKHLIESLNNGDNKETPVIYYVDLGYQRKRMTKDFIKVFQNDKLYFRLDDVLKAKSFLQARDGESQPDLESNFQKNFIDNFVEGESVFFISY